MDLIRVRGSLPSTSSSCARAFERMHEPYQLIAIVAIVASCSTHPSRQAAGVDPSGSSESQSPLKPEQPLQAQPDAATSASSVPVTGPDAGTAVNTSSADGGTLAKTSAARSSCGTARAMRMRGGDCNPGDIRCFMEMVREVPQAPRYFDPAPAAELADCTRDCRSGDGYHCYRVAVSYQEGKGAKRNVQRAAEFFGEACKLELENACEELWKLFEKDRRIPVTPAVRAYEKQCTEWSKPICARVPQAYEHGWGVPRDRSRAGELYSRYCEFFCKDAEASDRATCLRDEPMCWKARGLKKMP